MKLKNKTLLGATVVVALVVVAVVGLTSASGSTSRAATVKTGHVLGRTVLVNRAGHTLYSLSAETGGRFICTDNSCLSVWHPLTVKHGQKPTGVRSLATIRRPGGQTQVTYKGKPLYTFSGDTKAGEAKGEGFKDVGTWHAAVVGSATKAPAQAPAPTTTSPSYGGSGY
jgi:predicted lipoprotein with Yx(FWY)xxD motif